MKKHWFSIFYSLFLCALVVFALCKTFLIKENQSSNQIALDIFDTDSQTVSSENGSYTDTSYTDSNIAITLTTSKEYNTTIYTADIVISDLQLLKAALAENTYGVNYKDYTSSIAKENNAILAINGDFYGYSDRNKGYMIRNGILYDPSRPAWDTCLSINSDGTFSFYDESEISSTEILNSGCYQCFSFGPVLVKDGKVQSSSFSSSKNFTGKNPRTAIGIVAPLHYKMVVCDGRSSESAGLSISNLASYMESIGCTDAYNLDGGGSSTLYFNGKVINKPTTDGKSFTERKVSDIVYIGY